MYNRKLFNDFSAKLFDKLYDSFPIGLDINIEDFPELNTDGNSEIFSSTINFYSNEGFIRFEEKFYGVFTGVVLTSKGFSILNATPPEKFNTKSNIGAELKAALTVGKTAAIQDLISEIIKFTTKLIG